MFGLGVGEIAIILFIALIFIGPKKLPELAKGLGKGMREFQNAARGLQDQIRNPVEEVKDQVLAEPKPDQPQEQAKSQVESETESKDGPEDKAKSDPSKVS